MKNPTALLLLLALSGAAQSGQSANQPSVKSVPGLYDAGALPIGPTLAPGMEFTLLPEKYQLRATSFGTGALASADAAASLPQIAATWVGDPRWMSGVNFGGSTFFNSISHGVGFFNSAILPEQYVPVEIRFSSVPAEQTLCQTYRRDQGYPASGVGTFPGSAWDISDIANPRRLNILFVEDAAQKGPNLSWDPIGTPLGGREYLFIMNSDYDGTGLTYNTINILIDSPDVLYAWWPKVRAGFGFLQSLPASLLIEPIKVTNLYALPQPTSIELNWVNDIGPVDHFKIFSGPAQFPTSLLDSLPGTQTSYLHSGLTTGDTIHYRVEAFGPLTAITCCETAGDANRSGGVNIADVTFLIARIFAGGTAPVCDKEADANADTNVNIADVTFLIARIFAGGAAPTCTPPDGFASPNLGKSAGIVAVPQTVSSGIDLLAAWNKGTAGRYGDSWGYVDSISGKEYALLCDRDRGVEIIDLSTSPLASVALLPSSNPGGSDSKDVKVFSHYAIMINEHFPVQIFDIADVNNPVQVSTIQPNGTSGAHNCKVEGSFLYIMGSNGTGGVEIYDISDPASPVLVGGHQLFYYHDIEINNDTLYAAGINNNGILVLDISNKSAPSFVSIFNYPSSGAHNIAYIAGGFVAVGDEIGDDRHTRIFDINDPFSVTKVFDIIIDTLAITHNCYTKDSLLYIAHYTEGLRIWNVATPTAPFEVGYYDTFPQGSGGFGGAWNVYPYLPSGKIIVSDLNTGLYIFEESP
ncbi:MAG: choice-of-anchor B family protein [candidate division Zixibacteria bacterium]|nr:choice-of-anchor B family protein [candidate division Zixibacteria bacterium]